MSRRQSLHDQLKKYGPLVQEFRRRVASTPRDDVLRWCRGVSDLQLEMITQQEHLDALDAAEDESSTPLMLEQWASRLELLADAKDARRTPEHDWLDDLLGTRGTRVQPERELAANLRRAPEWRAERKAEWERTKPKPRVVYANQLAATCWREEPVPERLKRIDQVMEQIGALAREAREEGEIAEAMAIGQHASSLYKLREALEWPPGDEGS